MEQYMMIFRMKPDFSSQPTEAELQAMHEAWGSFIGNLAIKEKLVSTHRLDFNGKQITSQKVTSDGIRFSNSETISGNMIVNASSIDEATTLAQDCPILHAGGSVEVRAIAPM